VGLIGEAVAGIPNYHESAYSIFLNSVTYNFYPLLTILFVLAVAWTGRDFGPMRRAEVRARTTGEVVRPGAKLGHSEAEASELTAHPEKPQRAINAVLPVVVLVGVVLGGIYVTGLNNPERADDSLRAVIGSGNSYLAMMWGSLLSVLVAAGLSIGQRILTLTEVVDGRYAGLKTMLLAMIILVLAWALAGVNTELHTADYLVSVLSGSLLPALLPAMIFALAAATAFATGSSWGVMGIVMPLAIPLTWGVLEAHGYTGASELHLLYSAVAAVLAGAVWGDHCSPISDTTILSSMASQCDHVDHVRTQLPYALLVGVVAVGLGTIPVGFGLPWWVGLGLGAVVLMLVLRLLGRPIEGTPAALDAA
jgi:Na+/H+ antiporter NhaC